MAFKLDYHTLAGAVGGLGAMVVLAVKPIAKALAVRAIQNEGDAVQDEIREAIRIDGPKAANKVLDSIELRLVDAISYCYLPNFISAKIKNAIAAETFVLEERLDGLITGGGVIAFDKEYDALQAAIIAKVQAL